MSVHPISLKYITGLKNTDPNTVVIGDFNTPLSQVDRTSRQKINK
jgi:hypothetical protein